MTRTRLPRTRGALRLFVATAALAMAAGLSQTVLAAAPEGHAMAGGAGGHGMGMGMGMGGAGAHPRHVQRMLDAVNATAEQRAQIQQILLAAQPEMKAQHEAGRKLHEQGQALFAQPTVDARAVETLRQQMQALHEQGSKRMLQVMLDVSRVLTPEQRKTLSDRMSQRRAMMERHRSEREGMERTPR